MACKEIKGCPESEELTLENGFSSLKVFLKSLDKCLPAIMGTLSLVHESIKKVLETDVEAQKEKDKIKSIPKDKIESEKNSSSPTQLKDSGDKRS